MMAMPAPVMTLPPNAQQETVDFLRRLSSMLTGGRNAEMLQEAASLIETLGRRAASAEKLFQEQQEDHARNLELREVAELASDNLLSEIESLKVEVDSLNAQLDERTRQLAEHQQQAETDRNWFAEETLRAQTRAEQSEEQAAALKAEIDEMRRPQPMDESIAVVPMKSLQLARTQFDYLAKTFASNGDVVSMTICEIGSRALEAALGSSEPGKDAASK
jgi:DNA gyrase/topoisomerase IV subunit A